MHQGIALYYARLKKDYHNQDTQSSILNIPFLFSIFVEEKSAERDQRAPILCIYPLKMTQGLIG